MKAGPRTAVACHNIVRCMPAAKLQSKTILHRKALRHHGTSSFLFANRTNSMLLAHVRMDGGKADKLIKP